MNLLKWMSLNGHISTQIHGHIFFHGKVWIFNWNRYRSGLNEDAVVKVSEPLKYMLEINSLYPGDSAS